MADATEREREAQLALDTAYEACAMDDYDVDRYCDARIAYRAAVEARVLADVIAVVEGMDWQNTSWGQRLVCRTDLLTRLRAMESGA